MTFEEMFAKAKTALSKATVKDTAAAAAAQITVTGEGSGIFYVKVAAGALEVEPYDYKDNDVVLTVDSAELLTALTKAKTDALALEGSADKVAVIRAVLESLPATAERKRRTTSTATKKTAAKTGTTKAAATKTTATKKTATTKTAAAKTTTKATASKTADKTAETKPAAKRGRKPKTETEA